MKEMTLNEMAAESHAIAVQKGWYENGGPSALEKHMLMVSEIAEATEEVRNNKPPLRVEGKKKQTPDSTLWDFVSKVIPVKGEAIDFEMIMLETEGWGSDILKPEGEAAELADVIIRIGDYFGHKGWDLEAVVKLKMNYNRTRGHKHGGKAL